MPSVYLSVFVVAEAAVMLQHKPPLPPALHEARVSPLVEVATAGGPGGVGTAADVRAHHQGQDIWTWRHIQGRGEGIPRNQREGQRWVRGVDGETVQVSEMESNGATRAPR